MRILVMGQYSDGLRSALEPYHEVSAVQEPGECDVVELIREAELVIIRSPHRITGELLAEATRLRWIVRAGSGTDNIAAGCEERGIQVVTTPLNSQSVAELTFAMIFALYRNLRPLHEGVKEGKWEKYQTSGREVYGKEIGILGFGRVGQAVARLAGCLGMRIRIFDRSPEKPPKPELAGTLDAEFATFSTVLSRSDVVVICLPLSSDTVDLLNVKSFGLMRDGAVLINVGRGGIVDFDALYHSLTTGKLAGAGLDVYPQEPPGSHPMFQLENVICTPHIGAQTREARARIDERIVELVGGFSSETLDPGH